MAALKPTGTAQQIAFVNEVLPYALRESHKTGIPAAVYITQSGVETGWGTSGWWKDQHNPAGIAVTGAAGAGSGYPDVSTAFADYSNKLMGIGEYGQGQFVKDVKLGADVPTLLTDLQNSPWAAGHYGHHGLVDSFAQVFGGVAGHADPKRANAFQPNTVDLAGSGTGSTAGGGASGGGSDVLSTVTGVGAFLASPALGVAATLFGGGNPLSAAKSVGTFLTTVLGIFSNWRYIVEVFAGIGLVLLGVTIILIDTGAAKKGVQAAGTGAAVAAMA